MLPDHPRISGSSRWSATSRLITIPEPRLPGTTSAAGLKARVLKDIIDGARTIAEISPESAFEQLSHMKGGPSIEALQSYANAEFFTDLPDIEEPR